MRKPNGESKGFGFVCYKTAEAALSAIDAMHNATLGTQQLYVGFAQDKNNRKVALKKDIIHLSLFFKVVDSYRIISIFS